VKVLRIVLKIAPSNLYANGSPLHTTRPLCGGQSSFIDRVRSIVNSWQL